MKNLVKGFLCLSVFFASINVNAQTLPLPVREPDMTRPSIFPDLPQQIEINIYNLSILLQSEMGKPVTFPFSENVIFQGLVTSVASDPDNSFKSVVIKSTNFSGAVFSFSRAIKEDGTTSYTGRILSFQHADAYELNLLNGKYYFVKKGFYDLVNE